MTDKHVDLAGPGGSASGLSGRCPRCGRGKMFKGYLTLRERCDTCGLDYSFADSGDGPAVFVILLVGFIVVGAALGVEFAYQPPYWVHAVLWLPLLLVLSLGLLRILKSWMVVQQYRHAAREGRLDRGEGVSLPRAVVTAGIAALVGIVFAAGLGTWQLQRLAWKQGVIARIEARAHGDPQRIGAIEEQISRGNDVEYARVAVYGRFDHAGELHLYTPSGAEGPGWQLVTPFYATNGRAFYVNRGYVPETKLAEASRPEGDVTVTGLLRPYDRHGAFTPDNDPAANSWFWYEFDAMQGKLLETWQRRDALVLFPYVIESDAAPQGYPAGGATRLVIPNDHLQYALTWFGLALTLAGVYLVWARQQLRQA